MGLDLLLMSQKTYKFVNVFFSGFLMSNLTLKQF